MLTEVQKHYEKTEDLVRKIPKEEIASWFLKAGFFPENYVLPPSFQVVDFNLNKTPYNSNILDLARRQLISIAYPKTLLTSRVFSVMHPWNYHDIIFYLIENWDFVLEHLFNKENKIYSYSFPIPVTAKKEGKITSLRAGRMIYEWIEMAEKNLIVDSSQYQFIAKTDITNFYSSIYTHSIPWMLHGREKALRDRNCDFFGNKIDKLFQYSNDARTNGIPIGSALSDLTAEIILTGIDKNVSKKLECLNLDYVAVRFKDDYRILCQSEEKAKIILKTLNEELSFINLSINENKTHILKLPDGLYRKHDREYFPYSLREKKSISFKVFEHSLLIALDIHRNNLGTSILEKYISELFIESVKKNAFSKINGFSETDSEAIREQLKEKGILDYNYKVKKDIDLSDENIDLGVIDTYIKNKSDIICVLQQIKKLKIRFSKYYNKKEQEIKKIISLLFLVKRESEKLLCHVLSVIEQLYLMFKNDYPELKIFLKSTIENEIKMASQKESTFEIVWLIFFSRYLSLGIIKFDPLIENKSIKDNPFYKSIISSNQNIFNDSHIDLFKKPKDCRDKCLAVFLDVFKGSE